MRSKCSSWAIDVFSFGVILLEIASGYPVWMSTKCKATNHLGRSTIGMGIFGTQGDNSSPVNLKDIAE